MDRLKALRAGLGLGLALAVTGCRHARPEVPPERPFITTPQQVGTPPSVGFSSESAVNGYGAAAPAMTAPGAQPATAFPPSLVNPTRGVMGQPGQPPSPY